MMEWNRLRWSVSYKNPVCAWREQIAWGEIFIAATAAVLQSLHISLLLSHTELALIRTVILKTILFLFSTIAIWIF
jgi:hypothetical protein